jgi:hypothetical protein
MSIKKSDLEERKRSLRYWNNREKHLAYQKVYNAENKDAIREARRKRRRNMGEEERAKMLAKKRIDHLMRKYGLTSEDYDRMLQEQGGTCALCSRGPAQERYKRLSIDHCHNTGKVRGLLCTPCNCAIGILGDTVEHVRQAVTYLEKSQHDHNLIYSASNLRIVYEE